MSKYKPLYSSIWTDNQFENYSPEKKLVYIFLLTNQYVEKSGIYKVSVRQIAFNTSIAANIINDLINELINDGKIRYDFKDGIIFIKNLFKYQKGMIKNENILLLTLKRNYEIVKTEFWNEFFDRYSNDSLASKINGLLIDGSLMAHQLYINNNNNNNKDKNINKGGVGEDEKELKLKNDFEKIYRQFHAGKKIQVIPFDKLKTRFQKCLQNISYETLEIKIAQYLDYLEVATWRQRKDFAAWINDPASYANDWEADKVEELRKSQTNSSQKPKTSFGSQLNKF